jgi:nidogen (entactin)
MNGSRQQGIQTPLLVSHKMYGLAAVTDRCPLDFSPCVINNGDCPADHICFVNRFSPSGKSCKCVLTGACNIHDE